MSFTIIEIGSRINILLNLINNDETNLQKNVWYLKYYDTFVSHGMMSKLFYIIAF